MSESSLNREKGGTGRSGRFTRNTGTKMANGKTLESSVSGNNIYMPDTLEDIQRLHVLVLRGDNDALNPAQFLRAKPRNCIVNTYGSHDPEDGMDVLRTIAILRPDVVFADVDYEVELPIPEHENLTLVGKLLESQKSVDEAINGTSQNRIESKGGKKFVKFRGVDFLKYAQEFGSSVLLSSDESAESVAGMAYPQFYLQRKLEINWIPRSKQDSTGFKMAFGEYIASVRNAVFIPSPKDITHYMWLIIGATGTGKSTMIKAVQEISNAREEEIRNARENLRENLFDKDQVLFDMDQVPKGTSRDQRIDNAEMEGIEAVFGDEASLVRISNRVPGSCYSYGLYENKHYILGRRPIHRLLRHKHVFFATGSEELVLQMHADLGERLKTILLYPSREVVKERLVLTGKPERRAYVDSQYDGFDRMVKCGLIQHVLHYTHDEIADLAKRSTVETPSSLNEKQQQEEARKQALLDIGYRFAPRVVALVENAQKNPAPKIEKRFRRQTVAGQTPKLHVYAKAELSDNVKTAYIATHAQWIDQISNTLFGIPFDNLVSLINNSKSTERVPLHFDQKTIKSWLSYSPTPLSLIKEKGTRTVYAAGISHGIAYVFLNPFDDLMLPFGNETEPDIVKGLLRTCLSDFYFTEDNKTHIYSDTSRFAHLRAAKGTPRNLVETCINDAFLFQNTDMPWDGDIAELAANHASPYGFAIGFSKIPNLTPISRKDYKDRQENKLKPSSDENPTIPPV